MMKTDCVRCVFPDGSEAIVRGDLDLSMCIVGNGIANKLLRRTEPSCRALLKLAKSEGLHNCKTSVMKDGVVHYHGDTLNGGVLTFTGIGHTPWLIIKSLK
jgi:hypothetical protein